MLAPDKRALADANCFGGVPIDSNASSFTTEFVVRQGYALEYSSSAKDPLWVCESVSAAQISGHLARSNRFTPDPELKGPQADPGDYVKSGYDRGHQAPAGNQTTVQELKDQTFFMSNMAPQRPSLNRGIWKVLEEQSRRWVLRFGHAYEWTGPILCSPQFACAVERIGAGHVVVPPYFYKIILVQDHSVWKSIAFVLPNTNFSRPYHLEQYRTSIDWIESRTGIVFMPEAKANLQAAIKHDVSAMWVQ
jgi:endonuclease G, mitochondrial